MVDFNKLRTRKSKPKVIDPLEIFRRLPKPSGINDLYTSQAEVLQSWFERRKGRDTVLKLHTGGGKTLVGLLAAQSTLNELSEPVLYLTPTQQLVQQAIEKAQTYGIPATPYRKGQPLSEEFLNARAVMVAKLPTRLYLTGKVNSVYVARDNRHQSGQLFWMMRTSRFRLSGTPSLLQLTLATNGHGTRVWRSCFAKPLGSSIVLAPSMML